MDICVVTATGVQPLSTEAAVASRGTGAGVVWVDLEHWESEGMRLLADLVHPQPADVDDCFNRLPVPKLHAYGDHYFIAQPLPLRNHDLRARQLFPDVRIYQLIERRDACLALGLASAW